MNKLFATSVLKCEFLCSVLKTLIYAPLVEWSKPTKSRASALAESGEINNEKVTIVCDGNFGVRRQNISSDKLLK